MRRWAFVLCTLIVTGSISDKPAKAQQTSLDQVFAENKVSGDIRFEKPRNLRDTFHPWTPPETAEAWQIESERIRMQLLVSNGLWPLPERTPLKAVIHGRIEKDDYVIDKVVFASRPGHYVSGLLYRPKNVAGKVPAVLSPHGHWKNGRFYDAGAATAKQQIEQNAETLLCAARYPLQARMVQLARMGCVVFHYDMIGYADSKTLDHRTGFSDARASLRLQNLMGLQTWNSIRALDFVESLPEVDPQRLAVTGASGGGTQTFMLCAVDPRPAVAFPAVMVSTNMQGGCVCENADYLRIGINNIAIAALCAPRPMGLSGADDWSVDILTKGLPELKKVYSFFDSEDKVEARAWPEFKHNYNSISRNFMYEWFNKHLNLGVADLTERTFEPLTAKQSSVFDADHPRPPDALPAELLRQQLTSENIAWWKGIAPTTTAELSRYRQTIEAAVHVMLGQVPSPTDVEIDVLHKHRPNDELRIHTGITRRGAETVPFVSAFNNDFNGTAVLWISGHGKASLFDKSGQVLKPPIAQLVGSGAMVVSIDVLLTGEHQPTTPGTGRPNVDDKFPGYTFGYNRPLLSNRVRDILTAVSALNKLDRVNVVHLVGTDGAGPWVLLASATGMPADSVTITNCESFQFGDLTDVSDENFLPGALRYGDLGGIAALIPPRAIVVSSTRNDATADFALTTRVGELSGRNVELSPITLSDEDIAGRLLELSKRK
jgi:dienelactone hydrolase